MILSFIRRILAILFTLGAIWTLGFIWFTEEIPSHASSNGVGTDAIVVLTGGGLRFERGLHLLVDGQAPVLFVSGVKEGTSLATLLREPELKDIAARVPADKVELGYYARSTLQNAEEVKAWTARHPVKSIRLVTGSYHMPRSLYIIRKALPGISIVPEPVFPAEFRTSSWWFSGPSLRLVISEYHKYLASVVADELGITSEE